jgi:serine/threonine protein phosphatase PrpC
MLTHAAVHSVIGSSHALNEDRYRLLGSSVPLVERAAAGHLFAVVDGVGGAPKGRAAAQHLVDCLAAFFQPEQEHTLAGLTRHVQAINNTIHDWGLIPGSTRPLGAAAGTVAWLSPDEHLHLLHTGNTVALHHDGEELHVLTPSAAEGKGLAHCFGSGPGLEIAVSDHGFEPGDVLVLVTDGVTPKGMTLGALGAIVGSYFEDRLRFEELARAIVMRAKGNGSVDDITAVVVELEEW